MGKIGDIKVGYSCNNNCIHCVVAHKRKFGNRSTDSIKEGIDAANKCSHLIFTGGEPTIRKDFLEILDYAKTRFGEITIQTNGRMFSYLHFTKRVVDMTQSIKTFYVIAVHGDSKEVHDAITRVPGSFEQTMRGIENLNKMKCDIKVQVVVTKLNYERLPNIARIFQGKGIKKVQFPFVHPLGNTFKYSEKVVPRLSLVVPYVKSAIAISKKCGMNAETEGIPPCFLQEHMECISEFSRKREVEVICPEEVNENFDHIGTNYAKPEKCSACSRNKLCFGTWKEYFQIYGDNEFKVN